MSQNSKSSQDDKSQDDKSQDDKSQDDKSQNLQKNWLEWLVFAVSCVLVVATLGGLGFLALTQGDAPPKLKLSLGAPFAVAQGFQVPIRVENWGDQTAQDVQIEVEFRPVRGEKETSDFTLAFVPRHSQREGWVAFSQKPQKNELTARVLGFQKP